MKSQWSRSLALLLALAVGTGTLLADDSNKNKPGESGRSTAELEAQLQAQEERVQVLERLIAEQSRALDSLRAQMGTQSAAMQPAAMSAPAADGTALELERVAGELDALAEASHETGTKVAKLEQATAANQKSTETRINRIGPFAYSGDLRLRYEPFFGGTLSTSRHRTRFRLRFNAMAKMSDEFSGGFSLASGDVRDPISTNETFSGFYQRKALAIDRAFFQYDPMWAKGFRVTAGKFAAPFYRTELTLDNDTNVEGISQQMTFNLKDSPLSKVTVLAFQLPFREVSAGPNGTLYGGQVSTEWKLGSRLRFTSYGAFYDWQNADGIRAAQTGGTLAGSSNTNAASATQYASQFGILDLIAKFDIATGAARWPLMLQFNFANNTRACTNGLDPAVVPCNARDRSAYWAEARVGQTRETGDLQFGYQFIRLERESVLAAMNFSDLRAPTNTVTHRFGVGYQVAPRVTMNYTTLIGRQLVTGTATREPWLKRMQADLSYRF